MNRGLREHIGEIYDGNSWEQITGTLWQNGTPWELWKFEQDVDYDGKRWRCIIIEKNYLAPEDVSAIDYSEDILAEAWEL